ncbi:MAG: hypothetical protein U0470_09860 [Anaerolineae bacterium]
MHKVKIGTAEMDVKLRPGSDYMLVLTPGGAAPIGVLVDNNEYHKHGQSRPRRARGARIADTVIVPIMNGELVSRAAYGRHMNGESAFGVGPTTLEIRAQGPARWPRSRILRLADKEVKTFFIYGEKNASRSTASRTSRVRIRPRASRACGSSTPARRRSI